VPTDFELIDRVVKHRDKAAFSTLVDRHQQSLRYSLRQLTGWNEALADDLSQEVFIKAYQALSSFKQKSTFSTWLYRIAYNVFISHQRKAQTKLDRQLDDGKEVEELNSGNSFEYTHESELHRDLAKAMQLLSVQQRSALHLFLHQQCTQQEISVIMGVPLGTVKTLINRGRTLLQQSLAEWREGRDEHATA
jgi:RNA polymerase sigma-70 factor (ECF subfamily)